MRDQKWILCEHSHFEENIIPRTRDYASQREMAVDNLLELLASSEPEFRYNLSEFQQFSYLDF